MTSDPVVEAAAELRDAADEVRFWHGDRRGSWMNEIEIEDSRSEVRARLIAAMAKMGEMLR